MIGPGVKCSTIVRGRGPWVIRVIEADGESGYVRPGVTFASERGLRAAPVSVQAQRATAETRYPIAGVNGDFFVQSQGPFEAKPIGALVVGGEVISTPYPRSAFLLGADGRCSIQRLRLSAWVERPDGVRHDLKGVNQPCGADDLVLYTPRFGPTTHTKGPEVEAALAAVDLPVRLARTYRARVAGVGENGDLPIPADGVVLSAHGAAQEFLRSLKPDDEVQLHLEFDPPVAADTDAVGGGPTLVRDGRVVVKEDTEGFKPDVVAGRAPRTAVGFSGRRLFLVTVDGRDPGTSIGMSLVELAELMRELGCTDAMNLDGGGSTTAWVRGAVVTHPSGGGERRVAEALFLFSTAPKGPPVRLTVAPMEIAILAGASCPLALTAEDEFYNPVPAPLDLPRWWIEPDLGTVALQPDQGVSAAGVREQRALPTSLPAVNDRPAPGKARERASASGPGSESAAAFRRLSDRQTGRLRPGNQATLLAKSARLPVTTVETQPRTTNWRLTLRPNTSPSTRLAMLHVQSGTLTGDARLRIYARPPRLQITPAQAALPPGGAQSFAARALDERGQPLITDGVPVHWSCPAELGEVDESGLFHAAASPAHGELTAESAGTRVSIPIVIGVEARLLDGFEVAGRWTASTLPPTVRGSVTPTEAAPHEGQHVLRLEYDFSTERATRAVYANARLPLGQPLALRLWVRGDGGGAWLRARLRDARGQAQVIDFTRSLGRLDDWRELTASIPSALPGPLTLEALYLVEADPRAQPKGAIELDGLAGDYAPPKVADGNREVRYGRQQEGHAQVAP